MFLPSIVFIHGLTGNRETTWTAKNASGPWPKVLLGSDIPNARIFAYGYDADVMHWLKPAGQNTLEEHAKDLVNALCIERVTSKPPRPKQPVIFVVHSLGGLVVQNALWLCVNPKNERQSDLLNSTRGIIFMGTPHAGSGKAAFAKGIGQIIKASQLRSPNTRIISVLEKDSEILAGVCDGFHTMTNNRRTKIPINIHCFVEAQGVQSLGVSRDSKG
jgi:protein SERAC1